MSNLIPVILSGGAGTRLWPLSRASRPKQLTRLIGELTLLQQATLRVSGPRFQPPIIVASSDHRFAIAEQLIEIGVQDARIVLEPVARNTALAVAVACMAALEGDPDAVILALPADHYMDGGEVFHSAVEIGCRLAAVGRHVLFGVTPTGPSSAYGYIKAGSPLDPDDAAFEVADFVEKPLKAEAEILLASGHCFWNGGIFLLRPQTYLDELALFEPAVADCARLAFAGAQRDLDFIRLAEAPLASSPPLPIDRAVMERTRRAVVVPYAGAWTDVGSWSALWSLGEGDEGGNVVIGDVISRSSSGCYLRSEGPLIATVGVRDLVVVATGDAVLVAEMSSDQEVKLVVEALQREGRPEATVAPRVHRPWGWYEGVHIGDRFQVKRITVNPGESISLQRHLHRAEHWVIVTGTAKVTLDTTERLVFENESVYIPTGCIHRLANPGKLALSLIEVQVGSYLGEDDIVRFEDKYSRV